MLTAATKFILDLMMENEELKKFPKEFIQETFVWVKSWFLRPEDPKNSSKLADPDKAVEVKIDIIEDILKELESNKHFQHELSNYLTTYEYHQKRIKNVVTQADIEVEGDIRIGDTGRKASENMSKEKNVIQGGRIKAGGDFRLGDDIS